ncbi:MAG: hypothetical protein NPIRA06_22340 [Nitrospirales bacterium]|nr:MAG: hypothetical protein NPIRA06_22340 [Nitrospirales bacterium]
MSRLSFPSMIQNGILELEEKEKGDVIRVLQSERASNRKYTRIGYEFTSHVGNRMVEFAERF